jgi:phosphinothricin acetyltransferase
MLLNENEEIDNHQSFGVKIRFSKDEDVDSMLGIYMQHIRRGLDPNSASRIDFPQIEDLKRRRKNMQKHRLPHLVAEIGKTIVGYAYAVPFRKRPAYRYVLKHSIYVHQDYLHMGVGRQLMPELINSCAAAGYRQMIGYIDSTNQASISLHEAFGFHQAGYLKGIGYKYGKWTDSIIMQRSLGMGDKSSPSNA